MAIKIIKEGGDMRMLVPVYGQKCIFCGCEFEFNLEDTMPAVAVQDDMELPPHELRINCPHCNVELLSSPYPKRYELKS